MFIADVWLVTPRRAGMPLSVAFDIRAELEKRGLREAEPPAKLGIDGRVFSILLLAVRESAGSVRAMPADGDVDFLRVSAQGANWFERLRTRLGLGELDADVEADRIQLYRALARRMEAATETLRIGDIRSMNHLAVFVMKIAATLTEAEIADHILGNVKRGIAGGYMVEAVTEESVFKEIWSEVSTLTKAETDFVSANRMGAMNAKTTVCSIFGRAFGDSLPDYPSLSVPLGEAEANASLAFSAAPASAEAGVQAFWRAIYTKHSSHIMPSMRVLFGGAAEQDEPRIGKSADSAKGGVTDRERAMFAAVGESLAPAASAADRKMIEHGTALDRERCENSPTHRLCTAW